MLESHLTYLTYYLGPRQLQAIDPPAPVPQHLHLDQGHHLPRDAPRRIDRRRLGPPREPDRQVRAPEPLGAHPARPRAQQRAPGEPAEGVLADARGRPLQHPLLLRDRADTCLWSQQPCKCHLTYLSIYPSSCENQQKERKTELVDNAHFVFWFKDENENENERKSYLPS